MGLSVPVVAIVILDRLIRVTGCLQYRRCVIKRALHKGSMQADFSTTASGLQWRAEYERKLVAHRIETGL